MNKVELVETLYDESGLSKKRAKDVVDLFFDEALNVRKWSPPPDHRVL